MSSPSWPWIVIVSASIPSYIDPPPPGVVPGRAIRPQPAWPGSRELVPPRHDAARILAPRAAASSRSRNRRKRQMPSESEDVTVAIAVNGEATTNTVEARTLLVQYLRDVLGLTGTNIGCDTTLVRRVHRAARRRVGEVVHGARRPGRRPCGHHHRGPRRRRRPSTRCRRRSVRTTGSSAATARRAW